jgi:uncharacterized protein (TIGR02145 family)
MYIFKLLVTYIFCFVYYCFCQTISISGKVTDTSQTPIPNAQIKLEKTKQTTLSKEDGTFLLFDNAGAIKFRNNNSKQDQNVYFIKNGILLINTENITFAKITAFDIHGKNILSKEKINLHPGQNIINLALKNSGVYIYKISIGKKTVFLKDYSIIKQKEKKLVYSMEESSNFKLNAIPPFNDIIFVKKDGYLNFRMEITTPETTGLEIKMLVCSGTFKDIDSNEYQTVKIGSQIWSVENLRTTKFNDGTPIPKAEQLSQWAHLTTPAYCYYNNTSDSDSIKILGALYNWYTINTNKLAPLGWHIPTNEDWDTLQNYLIANGYNWDGSNSENKVAKSLASKTNWINCTENGAIGCDLSKNNKTGFSAIPAGSRYHDVDFNYIGQMCYFWTSSSFDQDHAYYRMLSSYLDFLDNYMSLKSCGFSVRLVKD